ncbi:hypothetical protein [Xanthomonas vasicola]|uniref:hypothetical protein n=3 Tax=Xanthomonas vasicola TaxID=56459 RepID=UPI001D0BFD1F|nr:hypothetical protein [Xanthomonas vasicola]
MLFDIAPGAARRTCPCYRVMQPLTAAGTVLGVPAAARSDVTIAALSNGVGCLIVGREPEPGSALAVRQGNLWLALPASIASARQKIEENSIKRLISKAVPLPEHYIY